MDLKKLHVQSKFLVTKDELTVDADEVKEVAGAHSDAEITALANQAIQADKDIISQIKVVQEDTYSRVIFPKGIVPLKMYFEDDNVLGGAYYYFNYSYNAVVTELNGLTQVNIEYRDDCIEIEGQFTNPELSELVFINADNIDSVDTTLNFNTYYLFFPVTSGGTKLYLHTGTCVSSEGLDTNYHIVSTQGTTFEGAGYPKDITKYVSFENLTDENGNRYVIAEYYVDNNKININAYNIRTSQTVNFAINSFDEDTVTEL